MIYSVVFILVVCRFLVLDVFDFFLGFVGI